MQSVSQWLCTGASPLVCFFRLTAPRRQVEDVLASADEGRYPCSSEWHRQGCQHRRRWRQCVPRAPRTCSTWPARTVNPDDQLYPGTTNNPVTKVNQ